jgi:hypothetical protein
LLLLLLLLLGKALKHTENLPPGVNSTAMMIITAA